MHAFAAASHDQQVVRSMAKPSA